MIDVIVWPQRAALSVAMMSVRLSVQWRNFKFWAPCKKEQGLPREIVLLSVPLL